MKLFMHIAVNVIPGHMYTIALLYYCILLYVYYYHVLYYILYYVICILLLY